MTRTAVLPFVSFLVISCGGSAHEPPPATAAAPAASAAPAPAPASSASAAPAASAEPAKEAVVGPPTVAWKDLTKEQRGKYMNAVVVPKMKELFQAQDPKEYASFGCATCHGKGADAGTFAMPNPDLPVLPGDPAGFQKLDKEHPDMMTFMSTKVKPTMAQLLGKEELDMKAPKPDTVGCGTCHTMAKAKGK